jgi:2'-5' RNA ligase
VRLFVGVEIDAKVAAAASALVDELRRRAQRLAPRARITWIPAERLHLTVRFIGNADEPAATAIDRALETALPVPTFEVSFAGVGAFPRTGRPQVLWAGIVAGHESLQQIEREVSRRLDVVGIPREDRPYSPHLTLARIRDAAGLKSRLLFADVGSEPLGTTHVEAITLFESRLSPKGPTYVPLRRTRLENV